MATGAWAAHLHGQMEVSGLRSKLQPMKNGTILSWLLNPLFSSLPVLHLHFLTVLLGIISQVSNLYAKQSLRSVFKELKLRQ